MTNSELEERIDKLEAKVDQVLELVYLGRHLIWFCKLLGWCGGAFIAVSTYLRTFGGHR